MPLCDITNGPPPATPPSKYAEYLLAEPEASPDPRLRALEARLAEAEARLAAKDSDLVLAAEAGFNLLQEKNALATRAAARERELEARIAELEAKAGAGGGGARVNTALIDEFQAQVDEAYAALAAKDGELAAAAREKEQLARALDDTRAELAVAANDAAAAAAELASAHADAEKANKIRAKLQLELEAAAESIRQGNETTAALIKLEREHEKVVATNVALREALADLEAKLDAAAPLAAAHAGLKEQLDFTREQMAELKNKVMEMQASAASLREENAELRAAGGGGTEDFAHASSLFAVQMNEEKTVLEKNLEAERQSRLATEHELKHKIEVNLAENARHISELEARELEHKAAIAQLECERVFKERLDELEAAAEQAKSMIQGCRQRAGPKTEAKIEALKEFKKLRMTVNRAERMAAKAVAAAARAADGYAAKLAALDAARAAGPQPVDA
ncbi:uncharacterized protein AMSG_06379 [Thecamonas trahens ATCC 50062]|uniref:Uncharacterized protein n=1 Tax=Thecamonas trahens ATCC 50062 TaxID=461836 RepID=A0A0L0DD08_THETB|nr:hypothetical protein AMSG_06379 [Thecamonas trahens ATCC 50062]KNC50227.1 hypothetical protein AMSG_06379 [Thecamonas trahens ATCC 50062]|eukprot:XP_013757059.1 hypothetical protein AMSG_06379 [Thecamonas trahens ATCC 50062]